MKELSRNLSYLSNLIPFLKQSRFLLPALFFLNKSLAQVNRVGNPSFENYISCSNPNYISKATYWNSLDSATFICGGLYQNVCYGNVPNTGYGFQAPKTGKAYIREAFYCITPCPPSTTRQYPKNRLLSNLTTNVVYCVKINVNLENVSANAIDAIGVYLGDSSLDTIKYCGLPLTYLTPQIQNSPGNIIGDTLNWVEISGTFTATGAEKYLLIGNFNSNAATTTTATGAGGGVWAEYFIDDVSVIDYNLPAYAGPDKNINLGDSAFIGRPPEIGLECTWTTGTTTVGTGGGIWVKPTSLGTFSYVVTQNICGNIKTDTVFVNMSSGINESAAFANSISVYPQPARDILNISLSNYYESIVEVKVIDVTGKIVRNENLPVRNSIAQIETSEFSSGIYIIRIISKNQVAQKRIAIVR